MKLVRFGKPGKERPGLIDGDGKIRDLTDIVPDISGEALGPRTLAKLARSSRIRCRSRARARASGLASGRWAISSPSA